MTDHYVEENGDRYIMYLADSDGGKIGYYVLYSGKLVRCEDDEE